MLSNHIRYALRLMRRSLGFTSVAVLSLALGIGANTAIFSLFYTIVLRPLPVAHPEQLVEFLQNRPDEPRMSFYWDWDSYTFFRDHNHIFSALTGMSFDNLATVRIGKSDSETMVEENALGNYFRVLGLRPALGRFFGPEDVPASGIGNVVVISWSFWNSRFNRNPAILGKKIFVGDDPKMIIGVAPRAYTGPRVGVRTDIWAPQELRNFTILARLKPGATRGQAQAEMSVLYRLALQQRASRTGNIRPGETTLQVEPAAAGLVHIRDQYAKPLLFLLVVVGLLLLLACINMAALLLARSAGRQREIAVRVGLGASRRQLVAQILTESIVLSLAGTLAGILFAYIATNMLVQIMATGRAFERVEIQVHPDLHLLLFTTAIALLTGFLFGLAPAYYAFRVAPVNALRRVGKGGDTSFWRLFGKSLVAAQVSLSIFLATAAAIFLNHLSRLRNFNLGFRSDHVLLITIDPSRSGYKLEQLAAFYHVLLHRFEAIPGVRSASISGCTPLEGCGTPGRYIFAEGHVERPEDRHRVSVTFVAPRYFKSLGIPLLAGRDFTSRDAEHSRVVIVNQMMARHYFPNANPIGKRITVDRNSQPGWFGTNEPYQIVGLVGDVKAVELRHAPYPTMYFDMFQENQLMDQFELRTFVDPLSIERPARRIVTDVLKAVPVTRGSTLSDQVDSNIVPERLIATLSEFFGLLGTALAGIGVYGLLAYTVARRTNEVGVRMALGATSGYVARLVLREVLGLVFAGLFAGTLLLLASRPLAISLIQDLHPDTPVSLGLGAGLILLVALLGSYIPISRAAHIDPMVALRHE